MSVWWIVVLCVSVGWAWSNVVYRGIHGHWLRWPYWWAAHGALLFSRRLKRWESSGTR